MKHTRKPIAVFIFCLAVFVLGGLNAVGVHAATTDWMELGGGQARLVAAKDPQTGKVEGLLELQLNPGWKTYWRAPGGSGIPPEFDFSRSKGISPPEIKFPSPTLIEIPDGTFAGYQKKVSFVFDAQSLGNHADIKLDLLIGLCEDICIPATASFALPSDELDRSDPKAGLAIEIAKSTIPEQINENAEGPKATLLTGNKVEILIAKQGFSAPPQLFIESRNGLAITFPKLSGEDDKHFSYSSSFHSDLAREKIVSGQFTLTIVGQHHSLEGPLQLGVN